MWMFSRYKVGSLICSSQEGLAVGLLASPAVPADMLPCPDHAVLQHSYAKSSPRRPAAWIFRFDVYPEQSKPIMQSRFGCLNERSSSLRLQMMGASHRVKWCSCIELNEVKYYIQNVFAKPATSGNKALGCWEVQPWMPSRLERLEVALVVPTTADRKDDCRFKVSKTRRKISIAFMSKIQSYGWDSSCKDTCSCSAVRFEYLSSPTRIQYMCANLWYLAVSCSRQHLAGLLFVSEEGSQLCSCMYVRILIHSIQSECRADYRLLTKQGVPGPTDYFVIPTVGKAVPELQLIADVRMWKQIMSRAERLDTSKICLKAICSPHCQL